MKIRTLGATAALVLLLGACGGSDDEAASKAISESVMDSSNSTFEVTQEQADCLGDGLVDEIGTEKLIDYGIITEDIEASDGLDSVKMEQEDAESAANTMQDCADIKEIFTGAMGDLPEESQACIDEKLTEEVLNEFLVAIFMDDQEAGTQSMMGALTECLTPAG